MPEARGRGQNEETSISGEVSIDRARFAINEGPRACTVVSTSTPPGRGLLLSHKFALERSGRSLTSRRIQVRGRFSRAGGPEPGKGVFLVLFPDVVVLYASFSSFDSFHPMR